jgi:hypothetical protein
VHGTASSPGALPTIALAEYIASELGKPLAPLTRVAFDGWSSLPPTYRIVHCAWALALALFGSVLSGVLVTNLAVVGPGRPDETRSYRPPSRLRWKWPALIGPSGF